MNVEGENDFRIRGNAFYELTNPEARGGSAEPGIVMVSYDTNCNGLPDDEWYELAGSHYRNPATLHNYTISYRRPDPDHEPVEDEDGYLNDLCYIPWTDSEGGSGYIARNIFHAQDYYPRWTSDDTLTFTGTLFAEQCGGYQRYWAILYTLCLRLGIRRQPSERVRRTQLIRHRQRRRFFRQSGETAGSRLHQGVYRHQANIAAGSGKHPPN